MDYAGRRPVDIATLADCAGLSVRHFARRFIGQLGVRPKLFARVVRVQSALETKALHALKSWTEVAHDFGYYDQMHMVHDFEQLAGGTPTAMLAQLEAVFVEEIRQFRSGMVCTEVFPAAARRYCERKPSCDGPAREWSLRETCHCSRIISQTRTRRAPS